MLQFQEPNLSEAAQYRELFLPMGDFGSDYCFGNVFIWAQAYGTMLARDDGFAFCRSGEAEKYHYLYPAGRGDETAALEKIFADAAAADKDFEIYSIAPETARSNPYLSDPTLFRLSTMDDYADFVYDTRALALLKGNQYHAKRNHINAFLEAHTHCRSVPITAADIEACRQINDAWFLDKYGDFSGIEYRCVQRALDHYDALGFTGGILYVDEKPAAFTLGEPLTQNMFCTHIEKAAPEFRNAYALLNREFARHISERYAYVNREDSAGNAGLHSAKMSYHPVLMTEKYIAQPTSAFREKRANARQG